MLCDSAIAALEQTDAAIIVTAWPEFTELPWQSLRDHMRKPVLIDGRRIFEAAQMDAHFQYMAIARQNKIAEEPVF